MIKLIKEGDYELIETKRQTRILVLDDRQSFPWINVDNLGEILVFSNKMHSAESVLAIGRYRIFEVKDEPKLADQQHLELMIGNQSWQGYLLPTGLPTETDTTNRIIPTQELISKPKLAYL